MNYTTIADVQIAPDRLVGADHPAFLVGEIGQNHNGEIATAMSMIDVAAGNGLDAVKLCKRHIPSDMTAAMRAQPCAGPQSYGATYGEHREALELTLDDYRPLSIAALSAGNMILFATACDIKSVDELERIDNPLYKVASRDLDNTPLIERIARTGKPIILSTGMYGMPTLTRAVDLIRRHHNDIIVLVCTSAYPTDYRDVGLADIAEIRDSLHVQVGVSDHTIGIMVPVVAVALGAVMVEKHITLARCGRGTDHACSLEPDGVHRWVRDTRNAELAMQHKRSCPTGVQESFEKLARSLVSRHLIHAGDLVRIDDVCLKSPGTGLGWCSRGMILGKTAKFDIPPDVTLDPSDFA